MAKFPLRKPIKGHSGEIHELDLKPITGGMLLEFGEPQASIVEYEGDGETRTRRVQIKMLPDVLKQYISALTGLDPGIVATMAPADITALYREIVSEIQGAGNFEKSPTS